MSGVCRAFALRQKRTGQHPHTGFLPELQCCRLAILNRQPQKEPCLGRHVTVQPCKHLVRDAVFLLIKRAVLNHMRLIGPDLRGRGLQGTGHRRTGIGAQLLNLHQCFGTTGQQARAQPRQVRAFGERVEQNHPLRVCTHFICDGERSDGGLITINL